MNTPTPGDLSARQVIADAIKLASSGQFGTAADVADWLRDELAALSALPAAGGKTSEPYVTFSPTGIHVDLNRFLSTPEGKALIKSTTPQPSAAEDAAVGAPGVRLRNAYLRAMEDTLRQLHSIVGMDSPDVDALIEKVRHLAAPAAGKGVDGFDAWWKSLPKQSGESPEMMGDREFAEHVWKAALTRQPVAGDGLRFTDVAVDQFQSVMAAHGFTVPVRVISDAFRTTMLCPAATPTDGGEGS